jgi:uncharacterized protein (DUF4415 family)
MERNANSSPSIVSEDMHGSVSNIPVTGFDSPPDAVSASLSQAHVAGSRLPGQRGRQKRPTKILVTMRFSPEVLAYFKAGGDGWQTRINDVLREHVSRHTCKPR